MQSDSTIDVMESVIDEVATFFEVSRAAAKIRLIDLGFEEAIGTFTYIDDKYVQAHGFKKGSLQRNQTFSVSGVDAVFQSNFSQQLRPRIQSGVFIYVDSHFCLNHPKYIEDEYGIVSMTDYARHHADECCLKFDLSIHSESAGGSKEYFTECVLYRDNTSKIVFEAKYAGDDINKDILKQAKAIQEFSKEVSDLLLTLPNSFTGTLKALMDWSDITVEKLSEASAVGAKTIQRMRNEEGYRATLETVIAVCVGMKLPPMASQYLVGKAGFALQNSEKHCTYFLILNGYYSHGIHKCNELLVSLGLDPLADGDA